MKKIYALVACALLTLGLGAQTLQTVPKGARTPHSTQRQTPPTTQSSQTFYVDYDYMDEAYNVDSLGGLYTRYIWDMNMNYDLTVGDTNLSYIVVDFSSFWDANYGLGPYSIASSSFNTYTIDSVFILAGHENNSSQPDTIIVKTIALNGSGYPQVNTVLDRDTIISSSANSYLFGTANDWLTSTVIGVEINHQINSNTTRFGIMIEYYGDRTDSLGVLAGFGDLGPGNCTSNPNLPNFAMPSHHATNSYRYDMRYSPQYGMLPSASGADTYYECNGQQGKQAGQDSEHFLQNWGVWTRITIDGVGINEVGTTGISLDQNIPNPAANSTTIKYNLAKNGSNVALEVYDVTGQLIESVDQGTQLAGQHQIDLNTTNYSAGVYFYTLNVDGVKVTKRMVISE
jgi:hypothetical protein